MKESKETVPEKSIKKMHNLVIGLAGPYGAGSSSLAEDLKELISDFPECLVQIIHVATIIENDYPHHMKGATPLAHTSDKERRKSLQKAGTELRLIDRELVGNAIVTEIFQIGRKLEIEEKLADKTLLVFIVDSVKNLYDVKILKKIYGDEFYLISVHAPHNERWLRMKNYKSWPDQESAFFEECDKRDSDEKTLDPKVEDAGQQVRKVAAIADYHIANTQNREHLKKDAARFINLVLGYGNDNQPSLHERSMHLAFSASMRSYCLSKQVGAAIIDRHGNVLGIGHNDVPKAFGGLYPTGTMDGDKRCYQTGDCRCINDTNKQERFKKLTGDIFDTFKIDDKDKLNQLVATSEFRESTEYCRAVHAEMEALLSISRNSGRSTVGATMYVTTYPCHNCTKHILCAGINKVFYIEPYPKSLAEELHSDAIDFSGKEEQEGCKKLQFLPYEGVAPHTYANFFSMKEERKLKDGSIIRKSKADAVRSPLFAKDLVKRSRTDNYNPITLGEMQVFVSYSERIKPKPDGEEGKKDGGAIN